MLKLSLGVLLSCVLFQYFVEPVASMVHEIQVDEEITNFDQIHNELLGRKTRRSFVIHDDDIIKTKRPKRDATDKAAQQFIGSENFDIKMNTIIRTQDSRAMGAEYLNETEKGSNNDCLMWCLDTVKCNVAVYAETKNKSCYLFNCGTPSSFRCGFTTHGFYTSSILKMPSKPIDYMQWKQQMKHENELANLRNQLDLATTSTTLATGNIPQARDTLPPTTAVAPIIESKDVNLQDLSSPGCKHYQFQCRQSKECIAIYNVCDGIPQCSDQSDEADDIHCPRNGADGVATNEEKTGVPIYSTLSPKIEQDVQNARMEESREQLENHRMEPNREGTYPVSNGNDFKMPTNIVGASEAEERTNLKHGDVPPADSRGSGMNWNNNRNYPLRDNIHDQEQEYSEPNNRLGNGGEPNVHFNPSSHIQTHNAFTAKHSSFLAAGNNYRPQQTAPNYAPAGSNYQLNEFYGENYEPAGRAPPPVKNSRISAPPDVAEYNHYGSGYRNEQSNYNGYRQLIHDSSVESSGGGAERPPHERYRGGDRMWGAAEQQSAAGYPSKSDESQMLPVDVNPNLKHSPYLNRYNEQSSNRPTKLYPQQQQHYSGPIENELSRMPSYLQSVNDMIPPHKHSLVVQPQVQNDEEPEDAIYEPLVEGPSNGHKTPQQNMPKPVISSTQLPTLKPSKLDTNKPKPGAILHNTTKVVQPALAHAPISAEIGMTVAELQQATRVHARESNGAVLALTLGLCVTALLVVSVGCRLRNIRRQLGRKGGRSSLAHDADYLVNGMYL